MVRICVCRSGKKKAHEVINFCDCAYRGSWVFGSCLLLDRNDRGETIDLVHIGTLHPAQEGTGVSREALHVPALTLCINGIKSQGAFSAPT